ncbi:MAG TPA: hypothetical protein VJJ26_01670 [Candidatus Babeliales bacterium]|nr:hypothetical protein [Candidatus Babeliales bacterium]
MNRKAFLNIILVAFCMNFCLLYPRSVVDPIPQKRSTSGKVADKKIVVAKEKVVPAVKAPKNAPPVLPKPKVKLSLEDIHSMALQQKPIVQGGSTTRSKSIIPAELTTDLFTQSQAHMSVPEVKKLIAATYNTKPYEKLIAAVLAREKEYANDYVFYHGVDNIWRVPQDLYTRLYAHFNSLSANSIKNFIFLRFEDVHGPSSVQEFLVTKLKEGGLMNDHPMGLFLIAANLALFGNVGVQPECTWQYFIKSRGHTNPTRVTYEKIMDSFSLTHKHINELMSLVDLYQTKEQTILQIFVPKDKVDRIGYLSWIRGIPAHQKTMNIVLRSVENKTFEKTAPAIAHYTKLFKQEQESNPIFKNLIERVKAGEFSLSYFLNFYRNRPNEIEGINSFQARLIFTPDVLLNTFSGVKIFRYSMATPEQLKKYQQKFDMIINKIIAEKKQ